MVSYSPKPQSQGNTASLCVRRSLFTDESGAEDPDKQGVCSNFLCDARPGDEVMLTGPAGKALLLPANSPEADIILVATGTGVASYRYAIFRCLWFIVILERMSWKNEMFLSRSIFILVSEDYLIYVLSDSIFDLQGLPPAPVRGGHPRCSCLHGPGLALSGRPVHRRPAVRRRLA